MFKCATIAAIALTFVTVNVVRADIFGSDENQFTIDFVQISGDAGDLGSWPAGLDHTFTGVNRDEYRIGTFEITNDQWEKFVASLGVPVMGEPSSAYDQDPHFTNVDVPINNVSWHEAAQFVNWLNTSSGYQAAYKFTGTQGTSDYTLDTWSSTEADNGTNLYRHKDVVYYLPTVDEWLKAGYWNGTELQTYATKPGETLHQGDLVSGTGWNYYDGGYHVTNPPGPWDVGSGSEELNGTFDLMGNVWEWMESPYSDPDYGIGSNRELRGGSYASEDDPALSSFGQDASLPPLDEPMNGGFRVASDVPEPSTLAFLSLGGLITARRRCR